MPTVADIRIAASESGRSWNGSTINQFPFKLHQLLDDVSNMKDSVSGNDLEDIVSWMPDGKSFGIHDRDRFGNEILPLYFNTTKTRSFQVRLKSDFYDDST